MAPDYYTTVVVPEGKGLEAISWYEKALHAKAVHQYKNEDGTLMHGFLRSDYGFPFAIDEVTPKFHNVDPVDAPKRASASYVYVNVTAPHKADDAVASMKAAGSTVTHEAADMFYGHRVGRVVDRYGVSWSFAHRIPCDNMVMPKKYGHDSDDTQPCTTHR